jgi:DnaD/phage-associated family protein
MKITRERISNYFLEDTQIPNIFIAEYMPDAPEACVKVYLYAYMLAGVGSAVTNDSIAKRLHLKPEDVLAAWTYLEKLKVIKKINKDAKDSQRYDVMFIDLKAHVLGYADKETAQTESPLYDGDIKELLCEIEQIIGKPLPSSDYEKISYLIQDTSARPDLIAFAYRYCIDRKKRTSAAYVGEIVRSWSESGIVSAADAEEHVDGIDLRYGIHKKIAKALGMKAGNLTDIEKGVFDKWLDDYGMSLDEIFTAAQKGAGKDNKYDYVRAVIENLQKERPGNSTGTRTINALRSRNQYYASKQQNNEDQADVRKQEAYEKLPKLPVIDSRIVSLNLEKAEIAISGAANRKKVEEEITANIKQLQAERKKLLEDAGLSENYTDIWYSCPRCNDTGILDDDSACDCFMQNHK